MPPERRGGDDPAEWLRRAKSNLIRAREDIRLPGVAKEDLCFDAQQAAEKAVKAVLIHLGIRFPYIHDLAALLALVEEHGESLPPHVKEAARLTRFAVETRYPSFDEPVTQEEYEQALATAEAVVRWAEGEIG
jgi:HEPN domain-containing protein